MSSLEPNIAVVASSLSSLKQALVRFDSDTLGFVPTMGALHEGHLALIRKAKAENGCALVSIFVNPKQFGPNEDLAKYPRTLAKDVELASAAGADIIFCPTELDIYPMGFSTAIDVGEVAKPLCGKYRPGHFSGVATVVARLFGIVKPQKAYFGQKDIQQCLVIQRMVEDLALPVELEICSTVREPDGLAMSSRNRYLSKEAREIAPVIYRALRSALALVGQANGSVASETVLAEAKKILQTQPKIEIQYLELRSFPLLEEVEVISGPTVFAFAGFLEGTRLIDNIILEPRT